MAEQKTMDFSMNNEGQQQHNISIAIWDKSVTASDILYSKNGREATRRKKSANSYPLARTVFLKKGRHIFNIKVNHMTHVGIGIVGRTFHPYDNKYIGETADSYGTWNNICAYYTAASLKPYIIHDIKIKKDDIVKVDLDLNDRTFLWEINGVIITKDIHIAFDGAVAVAAILNGVNDCVEIIQYFNQ